VRNYITWAIEIKDPTFKIFIAEEILAIFDEVSNNV